MKIAAVISEFNPFHNGHLHLVNQIRARLGDTALVAIMSGDFVQRGDVALIGKYSRAEAALACGFDLVLELPSPWCFCGAENFALGGVSIANAIGCVDFLCFGAECGDTEELSLSAKRLDSDGFSLECERVRSVKPELNEAALRAFAYQNLYGETALFEGSNNLLALEYLRSIRSLGSQIKPLAIPRIGASFGSEELSRFCSATAIRKAVKARSDVSGFMPTASYEILQREISAGRVYDLSLFDRAVCAVLRTKPADELAKFMEITGGMEHRLKRAAACERTIDGIIESAAQRRYSKSRLRRAILSAMLGVTMQDAKTPPRFTTLLGANQRGREVLALARHSATIPILSKTSQNKALEGTAKAQYEKHEAAVLLAELMLDSMPEMRRAVLTEGNDYDII